MRTRKLLLCCFAASLLRAQAPADDTKAPPAPKPPAADAKAALKTADSKKKIKTAADPAPAPPPSPEHLAAQSILGALGAALDAAAKRNPAADFSGFRKQQADLQSKLTPAADAQEISRQSSALLASVYGSAALVRVEPPASEDKPLVDLKPREGWQPWAVAILVALLSPLICVAGFWLGARSAEHNVKNSLREAGLL